MNNKYLKTLVIFYQLILITKLVKTNKKSILKKFVFIIIRIFHLKHEFIKMSNRKIPLSDCSKLKIILKVIFSGLK